MSQDPEQLEAMLADYVEGNLDEAAIRVVESHLAANPSGRALIDAMRSDRAALGNLPRLTVPGDLSEDLRGQLERELLLNDKPIGAIGSQRFSPSVAAIAAMLMVGLGLGAVAYVLLANRPTPYGDIAIQERPSTARTATTRTRMEMTVPARSDENAIGKDAKREAAPNASMSVNEDAGQAAAAPADSFRRDINPAAVMPAPTPAPDRDDSLAATSGGSKDKKSSITESTGGVSAAARADADVTPQATIDPAPAKTLAAPVAPKAPELQVAAGALPDGIAAALADQSIDIGRRSVVIAVEQRDALDAFATVSRAARASGTPFEVTERAAQIALPGSSNAMANAMQQNVMQQKITQQKDVEPDAEVAVIARGLSTSAAAMLQADLKKLEPAIEGIAYDVPADLTNAADRKLSMNAAKPTTNAAAGDAAAAIPPTTKPVAVGGPQPTTNAAKNAATQPSVIAIGEHLRVTLVDPDAFDLRTQHDVVVDAQGLIALPSLEHVHASGESVDALRVAIAEAYKAANLMRRPVVKVESIDSGSESDEIATRAKLVDLYLVVRKPAAVAEGSPTTRPTANDATTQSSPTSAPTTRSIR